MSKMVRCHLHLEAILIGCERNRHDAGIEDQDVELAIDLASRTTNRIERYAAVREAAEAVAIALSLVAPYTAEEMWEILGHAPSIARAGWPAIDPDLVSAEKVIAILQINGKIKDRIEVAPDISDQELEKLALQNPQIAAELNGAEVKKIISRAPKLVNIVI